MSRRFAVPRRRVRSPPGPELLGAITSHGPPRESYRSSRKSRGSAEAFSTPAAHAVLSAEGDASSAFIPGKRTSAIAARAAGRRRGSGRGGKPKRDIARRRQANKNATGKADAIGGIRDQRDWHFGKTEIARHQSAPFEGDRPTRGSY
jgi:hypothetical protein